MVHGTAVKFQYDSQFTHRSVTSMTILLIHKLVHMKRKYIISVISRMLAVL